MNTDVSLSLSNTSIIITNTGLIPTPIIESLLRQYIFFQHSSSRPEADYMSTVRVVANDGMFGYVPAFTMVEVVYSNSPPQVLVDGIVSDTTCCQMIF